MSFSLPCLEITTLVSFITGSGVIGYLLGRLGKADIHFFSEKDQNITVQTQDSLIVEDLTSDIREKLSDVVINDIGKYAQSCQLDNWHDLGKLFSRSFRASKCTIGVKSITIKSRIVLLNAGNHPALITSIKAKSNRNQSISSLPNSGNIYVNSISPQEISTIPLVIKSKGIVEIPINVVLTCEPKIERTEKLIEKYLSAIEFINKLTEGINLSFSSQVQYVSTTVVLLSKSRHTSKTFPLSYFIQNNFPSNTIDSQFIVDVLEQTNILNSALIKIGKDSLQKQVEAKILKDQESEHRFHRKLDKSARKCLKTLLEKCRDENLRTIFIESPENIDLYYISPDDDISQSIAIILPGTSDGLDIQFDLSENGANDLGVDIDKVTPQSGVPAWCIRSYHINSIGQIDEVMNIIMRVLIERNARK